MTPEDVKKRLVEREAAKDTYRRSIDECLNNCAFECIVEERRESALQLRIKRDFEKLFGRKTSSEVVAVSPLDEVLEEYREKGWTVDSVAYIEEGWLISISKRKITLSHREEKMTWTPQSGPNEFERHPEVDPPAYYKGTPSSEPTCNGRPIRQSLAGSGVYFDLPTIISSIEMAADMNRPEKENIVFSGDDMIWRWFVPYLCDGYDWLADRYRFPFPGSEDEKVRLRKLIAPAMQRTAVKHPMTPLFKAIAGAFAE